MNTRARYDCIYWIERVLFTVSEANISGSTKRTKPKTELSVGKQQKYERKLNESLHSITLSRHR